MTSLTIIQGEGARWQRFAVRELTTIVHTHSELPVIAWTVSSAGSVLVGQVPGSAPADEVREVFNTWRSTLGLTPHEEAGIGGGAVVLSATGDRDRVRVRLTATVISLAGPDQVVTW